MTKFTFYFTIKGLDMKGIKKKIIKLLRWTQKYTKTDMVYIVKGGFWLASGKGVLILISLATTVAFANLLPVETFGTYQFILAIVGFVSITSLPGIGTALVRTIAKGKDGSLSLAYRTRVKWALWGSLALLLVSGWYFFNENYILGSAFLILAPIFPFKITYGTTGNYWNGKKRFDVKMIIKVLADAGIAGSTIVALFLTNNVLVIVATFFGSTALFYSVAYLYTRGKTENDETDEDMISLGKNLTLMGAIGNMTSSLDKIILWKVLGPVQVAIYTLSLKPIKKVKGFIPISALALPKLSENGVGTYKKKKSVLRKMGLLFLITIPSALVLVILAPFAYSILFPQYMDSVPFFQALTFLFAMLPTTLLGDSLIAEMKTKYLYITKSAIPIIKIVLFLILAPIYGIWGIVISLISVSIIGALLNLYFFWKM